MNGIPGLVTHGLDRNTRHRMIMNQFRTIMRHMTPGRFVNMIKTETNRFLSREMIRSMPFVLKIESTNICNLKCRYCYGGRNTPAPGERPFGRMSIENFRRIIDEVGSWVLKINLYGYGEPLLFPETLDMIRYATDRNIGVTISSNMNLDNEALPDRIVDSGLETLIFSCHGTTQPVYEQFMTGGRLGYAIDNVQRVIDSRKKKKSKYPIVEWQYCVTGFNRHQCNDAVILSKSIGVDALRFVMPLFPEPPADSWRLGENSGDEGFKPLKFRCPWFYRAVYINCDGGVMPCCRDTRHSGNDFGNVFHNDGFASIWNNGLFRSGRRFVSGAEMVETETPAMCAGCMDAHKRMAAGD